MVNKVSLQLAASDYEQAAKYQQDAKHWTSHYLPSLLEQSFAALNIKEEYLFIDKIEIEIGDYPWKITDSVWMEKLTTAIRNHKSSSEQSTQFIKQWLFYLQFGVFERNAFVKNISDVETYFIKKHQSFSAEDIFLLAEIFDLVNASKRFFYQHSELFIQLCFSLIFKLNDQQAKKTTKYFIANFKQNEKSVSQLIRYLIYSIQKNNSSVFEEMIESIEQNKSIENLEQAIEQKTIAKPTGNRQQGDIIDASMECMNAGLVLMFPFVTRFFENISLVKNNEFINDDSKIKAVQALHFMATGKQTANEHELLLPKIICGIDLQQVIEIDEVLNANIEHEINDVLKAVIEHWSILQNTSVDGLRESFLQRSGKLTIEEEQYLLQVEESGVDILLAKIPWGFRNYKLPWMQKTMITEWH